jgi:Holliday junction resolvasome RuvABC endonuclease subunit
MIRLVGLDVALVNTGWVLVNLPTEEGAEPRLVDAGVVVTTKGDGDRELHPTIDATRRGQELHRAIARVFEAGDPEVVCVEAMSWPRHAKATAAMALAWGALSPLIMARPFVVARTPQVVKRAVTGRKTATKEEVLAELTKRFPNLPHVLRNVARSRWEHPSDALAAVVASLDSEEVRAMRAVAQRQPSLAR